ncbi:hypothetical protein BT63DRAFT_439506 [Microthyrium microscopicum]|uniref:SnoaL-like domain-containing protein n=1 Tax=Microthyrium microscopicum TaxID=703497 RepID=A0A6A6UDW3_9PEZI|nr:hypothetical protein BT63DRAFT_439506 [Microthyrium microscopicum]
MFILPITLLALSVAATPLSNKPYCPPQSATPAEQTTIFNEFINTFINKGAVIKALEVHAADTYIQHNPSALSGKEATINFFKSMPPGAKTTREIINQGFGGNNTGFVHYKMQRGEGKWTAVVDVYRMEGTCVVEHWDVMQEKPAGAKNPLAMWS